MPQGHSTGRLLLAARPLLWGAAAGWSQLASRISIAAGAAAAAAGQHAPRSRQQQLCAQGSSALSLVAQQQQQHHHHHRWHEQLGRAYHSQPVTHATTILCVRRGSEVVIIGDGQATQKDFIVKSNVRKVRRLGPSAVAGFAGVAVDGLSLLERLEKKLEEHPGQLQRAAVELAKMWRQDKILRELDASLVVADAQTTLWLMGNGDVLEGCDDGVMAIGSGADYAESAARALLQLQQDEGSSMMAAAAAACPAGAAAANSAAAAATRAAAAAEPAVAMPLFDVALAAMRIAADCCVYTNTNFSYHHITPGGEILSGSSNSGERQPASTPPAPTSGGGVS